MKIKKKKRSKGKAKGSQFERDICYQLSEWWTGKTEDCVFWRTDASGGRATVRRKKGLKTSGKCGDISSTHPCSQAFSKLITVELKVGYPGTSVADLFDRPKKLNNKTNQTQFEEFLEQAEQASENAGTPYWMLIHRRHKQETMVYMPAQLCDGLAESDKGYQITGHFRVTKPIIHIVARFHLVEKTEIWHIVGMRFDGFLSTFTPDHIIKLWKSLKRTM